MSRARRLWLKYAITEADYERMSRAQQGRCAICRALPKTLPLNVDHDHKYRYKRITTHKEILDGQPWWFARMDAHPDLNAWAQKRNDAIRSVRRQALRASIRGLLCIQCNPGLRKFRDNPRDLAMASEYLTRHQSGEPPPGLRKKKDL